AMETALAVYASKNLKVSTSKLNEVMQEALEKYHPPAVRGNYIQIKYVTQMPAQVPTFVFFTNYPNDVREPYKNYLENQLREHFPLSGVPINIFFRKK
ncbi:MAG TPA: ribosome biogenesis GTPase Der, partial [Chitinophagales bacterium]|nr:ribosome biogenesis GTPase Der [Chitinophagales bacterium]